jgi:hypothetical protein
VASQVVVNFIGNAASFVGATQKVESSAGQLQTKLTPLGKGLAAGLGFGFATTAAGLFQTAVGKVTDFIGDSVAAFNEDQASVAALGQSLKANIPGWDGNTTAIERVIEAQMKLGFTDDEQRSSLQLLVAATHDVTEAQRIQSVAMDLARFKSISLQEASAALVNIEAGKARGLATLGINTKDYATTTERLAAVEKVVSGAAADFAKTNEGELLISQVKVNEAMETFGKSIAPVQVKVMTELADRTTDLANVLGILQDGMSTNSDTATEQATSVLDLAGAFGVLIPGLGQMADAAKQAATDQQNLGAQTDHTGKNLDDLVTTVATVSSTASDGMDSFHGHASAALDAVGASSLQLARDYDANQRRIRAASDATVHQLVTDTNAMIRGYFDPIELANKLADQRATASADLFSLLHAKNKNASRVAREAIVQDLDDQATSLAGLGDQHRLTQKQVDTYARDVTAAYKAMGLKVPADIQKIIDHLHEVAKIHAAPTVTVKIYGAQALTTLAKQLGYIGNTDLYKTNPFRAGGGPVAANQPYIVGEQGPEWFVPGSSGAVMPNGTLPGSRSGGGAGQTVINVYGTVIDGPALDRFTNEIARRLRYAPAV